MTPERWQQVRAMLAGALERAPADRAAYLDQVSTEPSVRREVESLLAQEKGAEGFLEAPALEVAAKMLGNGPGQSLIGRQIGSYQVLSLLGAGGMGEVYRARDTKLGRDVAIKVLPTAFATDPERLSRFQREARMLASLNHPNIATIHGLEQAGEVNFLVMELIAGQTLAERLSAGPLNCTEALTISGQIAEALETAHEKGVIHRDLKPANVKVTPEGRVKVLDFGLAKAFAGDVGLDLSLVPTVTATGTNDRRILGTPVYMSPEQARGKLVDKRTDIWAFGCVLYELLTAWRTFPGDTLPDTIAAVLEKEPDWQALPPAVPVRIRDLLQRCLRKDRTLRLRDVGDARIEIHEALTAPETAEPTSTPKRRLGWVLGVAILVVGLSAGWWTGHRGTTAPSENPLGDAKFTRLTDLKGAESDASLSPDGNFAAFLSDRDGQLDVWLNQVSSGRFVNLTRGRYVVGRLPVRNLGFSGDGSEIWFAGAPGGRMRIIPFVGGTSRPFLTERTTEVTWSPDGGRLVYHTDAPGDPMFVADRTGADPKQIFADPTPGGHNHFQAWSPDGQWIYFARGIQATNEYDVWRIAASGGQPERLTRHNNYVAYPTPIDQRTVLYVARDQDGSGPWLWALDIERRITRRAAYGIEQYLSVAASANGRRLVATVANPSAKLWTVPILERLAEERDARPLALPTVRAIAPRFGGNSLFYLSSQGTGDGLWRFQSGQAFEVWKGAEGALFEPPAAAADGRMVAVVLRKQGKLRLHLVSADGAESRLLTDVVDVRGSASWSPDGKWIVTGGNDGTGPGLFKIPIDGGAPVRLVAGPAFNPVWSQAGTLIVYAGANTSVDAPLLAIHPDGTSVGLPVIRVRVQGERCRFLPGGTGLVYMQGDFPSQDFWLLDLATKKTRRLTLLNNNAAMRTFDISPDGKEIVFDRMQENSDVVLIDLPREGK